MMETKPVQLTLNLPPDASPASDPTTGWGDLHYDTKKIIVSYCESTALTALVQASKSDCTLVYDWAICEVDAAVRVREYPGIENYLGTLDRYSNLRCLNLSNVRINGEKIKDDQLDSIIHYCQYKGFKIEALDLSYLQLELKNLPLLTTLTKLSLKSNAAVSDEDLKRILENNRAIQELDLARTCLTLENAPPLTSLIKLSLFYSTRVSNAGLNKLLEGNTVIEELDLSKTCLTLINVRPLPTLTKLKLEGCKMVKDVGLNRLLAGNKAMRELDLSKTNLTLENVPSLPTLIILSLDENPQATDAGFNKLLAGNKVMRELGLCQTNLTLGNASSLPDLIVLAIDCNWQIRDAGLTKLLVGNEVIQRLYSLRTYISPSLVKEILSRRHNTRPGWLKKDDCTLR